MLKKNIDEKIKCINEKKMHRKITVKWDKSDIAKLIKADVKKIFFSEN
jgi:hypothetical protein